MFGFGEKRNPEHYIRGQFGSAVLKRAATDLILHFSNLDGWQARRVNLPEIGTLAAFLAMHTMRDHRRRSKLTEQQIVEVAIGALQGICRGYANQINLDAAELDKVMRQSFERFKEYDAIWDGCMKENDMGAFYLHAFSAVQAGNDGTIQDGFFDHCQTFGQVCIKLDAELAALI